MKHLAPRQLQNSSGGPSGIWHYTCQDSTGIYSIGYCEFCEGHSTPTEACEHYKEYILDTRLVFREDKPDPKTVYRCSVEGCSELTSGTVQVGQLHFFHVCSKHRNREAVVNLFEVSEYWMS